MPEPKSVTTNQTSNIDQQPPRPLVFNDVEAARILGLQPSTLRKWRSQGVGPVYIKLGRITKYSMADLERFVEKQKVTR